MKRILVNIACLIIGIVVAVAAMKLISKDKAGPAAGKQAATKTVELTSSESPAPQAAKKEGAPKKVAPLNSEATKPEEIPAALSEAERFQELMKKIYAGEATPDEQLAFWEQVRSSEAFNDLIAEQERNTPLESDDIESQMKLADCYVAKLLAAAAGPEKGLWGMKAMERWRAVLDTDPNHRDAQYSVAFSLSQYPDFMNKTGEAIREYEKVVELQRNVDPEPNQAKVYLELYRLYQKRGDQANAFDTIQEGMERFPDNQQLIDQHNSISVME